MITMRSLLILCISLSLALAAPLAEAAKKRHPIRNAILGAAATLVAKKAIKTQAQKQALKHIPAPRGNPSGFPDLQPMKRKTSVQGGGGMRKRWEDNEGRIYEWDSRHGTLEKYDRTGKHLGEFDAGTGAQLKGPNAARRIEP